MNELETNLKNLITSRYRSVREFSIKAGIPYTTVETILKRGLLNSTINNVMKICNELKIDVHALPEGRIEPLPKPVKTDFDSETLKVARAYEKASSENRFAVRHVLKLD